MNKNFLSIIFFEWCILFPYAFYIQLDYANTSIIDVFEKT